MNKELSEILSGFKKTWQLLHANEKQRLIFATFLIITSGALTNLPALILGKLVDRVIASPAFYFSLALPFILLIAVIILIREAITVARKYLIHSVATQTEKKQTVQVIEHLLKVDISYLNQQQIGSLHGRTIRSIQGLVDLIRLGFQDFFPTFAAALSAIIIALFQKPILASVMILVIPTGLFLILKQISSQKGIRVSLLRGKEKIDGSVVEMLGGIETIRTLNTTHQEVSKIDQTTKSLEKIEIHHHLMMALFDAAKYLNEGFFYILVIALAILFSSQGIITRGDILVYSVLFLSITGPLREIHRILDHAHEDSILVTDLYSLLKEPEDIAFNGSKNHSPLYGDNKKAIEISNLSFAYPQKPELKILKEINLVIKQGEKIGIAGASGCGKSTLIKILLRLIHGYSGKVFILGKNLEELSQHSVSEKIAYIPQKTYIFSGTIRENIVYGTHTQVSDQKIKQAAKEACILEEIESSLGGLEGKVAENGNNLSGGQKQRLAMARLILKAPEILIFDEATSALDNTNERRIQNNLERLFKDKTTITIAHRLTTLENCDRILVFDQGKIIQEGKFDTLAKTPGLFKDFLEQRGN